MLECYVIRSGSGQISERCESLSAKRRCRWLCSVQITIWADRVVCIILTNTTFRKLIILKLFDTHYHHHRAVLHATYVSVALRKIIKSKNSKRFFRLQIPIYKVTERMKIALFSKPSKSYLLLVKIFYVSVSESSGTFCSLYVIIQRIEFCLFYPSDWNNCLRRPSWWHFVIDITVHYVPWHESVHKSIYVWEQMCKYVILAFGKSCGRTLKIEKKEDRQK